MAEISLSIGKDEKHGLEASVSFWTRHLKISVDKEAVAGSKAWAREKTATFSVGEKEKHKVDVKASGSLIPQIKVWVDGELVATG